MKRDILVKNNLKNVVSKLNTKNIEIVSKAKIQKNTKIPADKLTCFGQRGPKGASRRLIKRESKVQRK